MNIVKLPLADLKRPERNIRIHPEAQIREYVRSVKKNGQIKLLVIDENNTILIGNGLHEAMLRSGYTEAYCIVKAGMTEADKMKMMMADNKIFGLGIDNLDTFNAFLEELADDLDIPGYDEDILRSMVADAEEVSERISEYGTIDDDEIEEIRAAREKKEALITKAEQATPVPVAVSVPPTPAQAPAPPMHEVSTPAAEMQKCITCPKCGEKIWL